MNVSRMRTSTSLPAVALVLALLVTVFTSGTAEAHQPHFNSAGSPDPAHPYILKHLDISQVVYGTLAHPGRVDYYQLTVPAGFQADIQIVVPAVARCANFRPVLAIAGPGIATGSGTPVPAAGTPIPTPPSGARWSILDQAHWGTFFEPFSRTTYATGPQFLHQLAGGTYLVAVYAPDGHVGTYGLALGGAERPGGDLAFFKKIGPIVHCEVSS